MLFFMLSRFSLTVIDSQGIVHLAFSLVCMNSVVISKRAMIKFSYLSCGVCVLDSS